VTSDLLRQLRSISGNAIGGKLFEQVKRGVDAEYAPRPQYGAAKLPGNIDGGDNLIDTPRTANGKEVGKEAGK
jgi:hypothetical protein